MSEKTELALARMIYVAIVFSTFIYAFIIVFVTRNHQPAGPLDAEIQKPVVLALYAVAALTWLGTFPLAGLIGRSAPFRTALVVKLALFESVVIYGLIAAFLNFDWRLFVPTWILGLVGFAMSFPTEGRARLSPHAENQGRDPRFR